jgi:hypothetical protein
MLQVPLASEVRVEDVPRFITNFGSGALVR